MKRKNENCGAVCGGVISLSRQIKAMKKYGIFINAMSFVMDDKHYKKYCDLKAKNKHKEAKKLFDKYARSQI